MKKLIVGLSLLLSIYVLSNDGERARDAKELTYLKKIPTTPVRDQFKSNTCWSFAGISLIETELIRLGKGNIDLSEMFTVHLNYQKKAKRYIRMQSKVNFAAGGEINDVFDVVNEFGIVPESIYSGIKPKAGKHKHLEMDDVLKVYIGALADSKDQKPDPNWRKEYMQLLDSYLGKIPEKFTYLDKEHTPQSFARELEIERENYVMLTSFNHTPYFQEMVVEVPDNWSWASSYNLPLDLLEAVVDSAILAGFSVGWATDYTEEGFNYKKGFALVPKLLYTDHEDRKAAKWMKRSKSERDSIIFSKATPVEEIEVTPALRQVAYENYSTTDDHAMHIVGLAEDIHGRKFYYVKNSWGEDNLYKGYVHVSKAYFKYKTISVMLHKNSIPDDIQRKLFN